jgi:hypothetical protein
MSTSRRGLTTGWKWPGSPSAELSGYSHNARHIESQRRKQPTRPIPRRLGIVSNLGKFMNSPHWRNLPEPDLERRLLSIEEFIDSVTDTSRRADYREILVSLQRLLMMLLQFYPAIDPDITIRVQTNAPADATGSGDMSNRIIIASGLLNQVLQDSRFAGEIRFRKTPARPFGRHTCAKVSLMWAFAHEYFHLQRRHDLVKAQFPDLPEIDKGLEYDADMCAVAALLRFVRLSGLPPFKSKAVVLCSLFWGFRRLVAIRQSIEGEPCHPHPLGRLVDVVGKLAILNDEQPYRGNEWTPLQASQHRRLLSIFVDLEKDYRRHETSGGRARPLLELHSLLREIHAFTLYRVRAWQLVAPFVEQLMTMPREVAPGTSSVIFIGDLFGLQEAVSAIRSVDELPSSRDLPWFQENKGR